MGYDMLAQRPMLDEVALLSFLVLGETHTGCRAVTLCL